MASEIDRAYGRYIVDWNVSLAISLFLQFWICFQLLTYKCIRKPLLGNLFVVGRIFFGRLRPEYIQYWHTLKFLQLLLTVWVIIFTDIIFRFAVDCFNQHCEQCKGFFERKLERWQFQTKHWLKSKNWMIIYQTGVFRTPSNIVELFVKTVNK